MWYNKYVGIPYKDKGRDSTGVDCWGLVRLIYNEQYGTQLPSFSEYYESGVTLGIQETIAQQKENWYRVESPEPGDVILFKVLGHESHLGLYVGANYFIHAMEGVDQVVIQKLNSAEWNRRIAGFFRYKESFDALLTGLSHPLKREQFSEQILETTTVQEIVDKIKTKYAIYTETNTECLVFINGDLIPEKDFALRKINSGDKIEFRSLVKGSSSRNFLLLALVVVSALYLGPTVGAQIQSAVTGVTVTTATAGYAAAGTMLVNIAGMALINAIAPVVTPKTSDPGQPVSANLFNGGSNQATPYAPIPVVLGKIRYTPPLGAQQIVEFEDANKSRLNSLVAWGFGPLLVEDIQIGTKSINDFTGFDSTTSIQTYTGSAGDNFSKTDQIYKSDTKQYVTGNPVLLQNIKAGSEEADGETNASVLLNEHTIILDQVSDKLKIGLHFPEGLRVVKVRGDGSGDITAAQAVFDYTYQPIDANGDPTGPEYSNTIQIVAQTEVMPPPLQPITDNTWDSSNAGGDGGGE